MQLSKVLGRVPSVMASWRTKSTNGACNVTRDVGGSWVCGASLYLEMFVVELSKALEDPGYVSVRGVGLV